MKITAIEIRQHTFERGLRGYKTEEVDAFLISLSQEWERLTGDYKMLKMQLELAEKELGKLKEVEMTLFRTLKTAEDTSTQITDQATKAADQHVAEARHKADELLADARKKSALMVQDAENQSRFLKDNILNDLKVLEHDFKALEKYKENLGVQIRALAGNAIDSVDRFEKKFAKQNLIGKIDEVATQISADLDQIDSKKQAHATPSDPATPSESKPVDGLPPLVEREQAVPEAIPVDEPLVTKLDEALTEPAADTTEPPAELPVQETVTAESAPAEATPVNDQPTEVPQEQPKKSGSFFDQI